MYAYVLQSVHYYTMCLVSQIFKSTNSGGVSGIESLLLPGSVTRTTGRGEHRRRVVGVSWVAKLHLGMDKS